MKYDIDYSGLDEIAKYNKALEDIKDYLGIDRFNAITEHFRKEEMSVDTFALMLSLVGVSGYPVRAWYNYCYQRSIPELQTERETEREREEYDMIDTNLTDAHARIRTLEAQLAKALKVNNGICNLLKALEQAEQQLDYGQINAAHRIIIRALEAQGGKQT